MVWCSGKGIAWNIVTLLLLLWRSTIEDRRGRQSGPIKKLCVLEQTQTETNKIM
jgi:hypothetical protein